MKYMKLGDIVEVNPKRKIVNAPTTDKEKLKYKKLSESGERIQCWNGHNPYKDGADCKYCEEVRV